MSVVDERVLREAAVKRSYNEGWENGMEKGRAEEAIDIAKKMKQKGMTSDLITEMTGLSIDVVESLQ